MAWRQGQSGNPQGRRAEKPFRDALKMELLAAGDDSKALRKVARSLINKASEGDMAAIRELADRTDGKVAQQVDLGNAYNEDGEITELRLTIVDPRR